MSYLTDTATYIIDLVDNHGETEDCKLEQCAVCNEIIKMRKTLDDKVTSAERKSNKKTTYLLTNVKTGETKEFLVIREICEFLGVGRGTVQGRLATQKVIDNIKIERVKKNRRLGGFVVCSNRRWTEEEVEYLVDSYGVYSDKRIAQNLDRTVYSIISKAQKLNISKRDNGELINISVFCRETGISRSTMEYWIKRCDFPTRRKGKYRKISVEKFWKWAEKNKFRINWSEFPKYTIHSEPDWVDVCRKENIKKTGKRREWSAWEINELKRLLKKEKYTYLEISEKLNRSHAAIKRKIYDLNLMYTPIYKSKRDYYSEQEVNEAIKLLEKGVELTVVAKKLNRSESGLQGKLERVVKQNEFQR